MTADKLLDEQWKIDFGTAKSMRYHAYRRSFWQSWDYWSKVITILSGTAVLVTLVGKSPDWIAETFAFIVAAFSAADLVLGFSDRAKLHDKLYRDFCRLQQSITETINLTESNIATWRRQRLEIEMDEPGTLDLLERRCAGEEAKARGVALRPSWKLTSWQVLWSQFSFFPSFPRVE